MKKTLAGLTWLLFSSWAVAQSNPEKYAGTITSATLKNELSVIAGPGMQGRETATEGQRKAAAYIANQFKQAGLLPAPGTTDYQQAFPLFYDTLLNAEMELGRKELVFGKDFLATLSANESAEIKGKRLVFAGYGVSDSTYDDYQDKNVKGKIVVVFYGEPKQGDKYLVSGTNRPSKWMFQGNANKARVAKEKGAKALIVINPNTPEFKPETLAGIRRSNIYYPRPAGSVSETVNQVTISHDLASQLLGDDRFKDLLSKAKAFEPFTNAGFSVKKKIEIEFKEQQIPQSSTNVVGFIEGTDKKDEYVVLTGHYDHLGQRGEVIYYGADDDGSGTTSVVEMAKAFGKAKAEGNGPRRSVVFMTVSGEEKGLLGSQYYSEHPLFPLEKTSVNLNTDMVGRIDPSRKEGDSTNYVYIIGDDRLSTELQPITDKINNKFVNLELDRRFNGNDPQRFYFRSDHYNFAKAGVPIIFYFNGTHADYHKPTDTVDKINFDLMAKRVHLVFHTAWEMANRDAMLKRDISLK